MIFEFKVLQRVSKVVDLFTDDIVDARESCLIENVVERNRFRRDVACYCFYRDILYWPSEAFQVAVEWTDNEPFVQHASGHSIAESDPFPLPCRAEICSLRFNLNAQFPSSLCDRFVNLLYTGL